MLIYKFIILKAGSAKGQNASNLGMLYLLAFTELSKTPSTLALHINKYNIFAPIKNRKVNM